MLKEPRNGPAACGDCSVQCPGYFVNDWRSCRTQQGGKWPCARVLKLLLLAFHKRSRNGSLPVSPLVHYSHRSYRLYIEDAFKVLGESNPKQGKSVYYFNLYCYKQGEKKD